MITSVFSFQQSKKKEIFYEIIFSLVVAQMIEQSLSTPDVRGLSSIRDINDQYSTNCNLEKTKLMKKRPVMAHVYKKKKTKGNSFLDQL